MQEEEKRYDQIERYLSGEMHGEELIAFEQAMENDPALKEEVQWNQEAQEVIVDHNLLALKEKMKGFEPTPTFNWKKWLGISGALLVLTAVSLFVLTDRAPEQSIVKQPTTTAIEIGAQEKTTKEEQADKDVSNVPSATKNSVPTEKTTTPSDIPLVEQPATTEVSRTEPADSTLNTIKPINKDQNASPSNTFVCDDFHLTYSLENTKTCQGEAAGSINLSKVVGGKEPYSFSLDADQYQSSGTFANLEAGNYTVVIKDANDCVDLVDVTIAQEFCGPEYEKVFSPGAGELWNIPYDSKKSGIFSVMNRKNQEVYRVTFENNTPDVWNGKDSQGQNLPMGLYIFKITYEDGKTFGGSVSIVR